MAEGQTSPVMDCRLLALACYGSCQDLASLLNRSEDEEAFLQESILDGVTAGGDTVLHAVATYGDSVDSLEKARLLHSRSVGLLYMINNKGDTPIICAARAANVQMVSLLIDLARYADTEKYGVKTLLRMSNRSKWTPLHESVRAGHIDLVRLLMEEDPELARYPEDGISPLYLAMFQPKTEIARMLYEMSGGLLSYSGPKRQNALHAAVLRSTDLTEMLIHWNKNLAMEQDGNGSTPLHLAASMLPTIERRTIHSILIKTNPYQLYQRDFEGFFPAHLAASIDATLAISDFLQKSPSCAGLRDARGRTYLHVAVDKMSTNTVSSACINQFSQLILNMQDDEGNTALHLAVQKGSFTMFCSLLRNTQVQLDLTNEKGETPLDIACCKISRGLYYSQNSEVKIQRALKFATSKWVICPQDFFERNDITQAGNPEYAIQLLKDSTENLCIGSVLIATVTFGATFAMPGGYRADDHTNGGTPTLAGRYTFDAFTLANGLAFTLSAMAVISLMCSGSPFHNPRCRMSHLRRAYYLMLVSVKSLVAAFAIGIYMMIAPVAHQTAILVCFMSSLVLVYQSLDMIIKNISLIAPFCIRKGIASTFLWFVSFIGCNVLAEYWPIIVIFCAALRN